MSPEAAAAQAVPRLDGKRALVTGGTGIGAAIAELLASQGALVAIAARHDPGSPKRSTQTSSQPFGWTAPSCPR